MQRKNLVFVITLGLLFNALPAMATVAQKMDLRSLSAHADQVWVARVGAVRAHFLPDDRHIVSDASLEILQALTGGQPSAADPVVVLRVSGGIVGDLGQRVSGSAALIPGEEILVFAQAAKKDPQGPSVFRVVGMAQGLFHIQRDSQGRAWAQRKTAQLSLLDAQGKTLAPAKNSPLLLQVLIDQVKQSLRPAAQDPLR